MQLLASRIRLRLSVRRRDLFVEIRSASLTLPGGLIPTHIRAHPFATPRALVEMCLSFLHSGGESGIVRLSANGSLKLVRRVPSRAGPSAKNTSGGAQQRSRGPDR